MALLTSSGLRCVAAAGVVVAFILRAETAMAQPAPPQANWSEFAQLAAYGLQAYDEHNSCNQQPFACRSDQSVCNWVDANTIETFADYAIATGDNMGGYIDGLANEASCWYANGVGAPNTTPENPWNSFGNDPGFNDDAMWWANAFIRLYDYSRDTKYLTYAEEIFRTVSTWWGANQPYLTCAAGGIAWRPTNSPNQNPGQELNAITNELFLQTATALALRTCQTQTEPWCFLPGTHTLDPGEPQAIYAECGNGKGLTFIQWATVEWNWFNSSFIGNGQSSIPDQLVYPCTPNTTTYTYDNGVILGGLTGLAEIEAQWPGSTGASPDTYVGEAYNLADYITSGMTNLTYNMPNLGPIVVEPTCTLTANCDEGTQQFKGIFMRYLGRLNEWSYAPPYGSGKSYGTPYQYNTFITSNAASLWTGTRQCAGAGLSGDPGAGYTDIFGEDWRGLNGYASTQSTQNSALDLLVAAAGYSAADVGKTLAVGFSANVNTQNGYIGGGTCSQATGTQGACCAQNAFDGDYSTEWCVNQFVAGGGPPGLPNENWVQVSFSEPTDINAINLRRVNGALPETSSTSGYAGVTGVDFQVYSWDGSNWTKLAMLNAADPGWGCATSYIPNVGAAGSHWLLGSGVALAQTLLRVYVGESSPTAGGDTGVSAAWEIEIYGQGEAPPGSCLPNCNVGATAKEARGGWQVEGGALAVLGAIGLGGVRRMRRRR